MPRGLRLVGDLLFVVAAISVLTAVLIYAGLQIVGIRFYEVNSPSMAPTFGKGAVVGVKPVAAHEVKVGQVIAFHRDGFGEPIVHRVTRIQSNPDIRAIYQDPDGRVLKTSMTYSPRTFWTKGDANPVEDSATVSDSALIGRQVLVVPWPFNLIVTKFSKHSLMFVGAGSILLFLGWEVVDALKGVIGNQRRKRIEG